MYLKTRALVLRTTDYNDRDTLLTLLTPQHGKITAKVRGLRRKNNPMSAACQILTCCEFTLFEYGSFYTVNEAVPAASFPGLQKDLCKLSLGTYFAQVAELLSQEDMPNPELLSLILNCLHVLSQDSQPEQKVKAVFELRCACLSGYMPDLGRCHQCQKEKVDYFDLSAGHLVCFDCRTETDSGIRLPISPGVLEAMRYIVYCDAKKLFSFTVGDDALIQLSQITEAYLTTQLERGFSTLDFYKSLLI